MNLLLNKGGTQCQKEMKFSARESKVQVLQEVDNRVKKYNNAMNIYISFTLEY
jgi:hypothetical protein